MNIDKMRRLAICLQMICEPVNSKNPVAWFELEQEGITREAMKKQVEEGNWVGPSPRFKSAPDRNGPIWRALQELKESSK